MRLGETDPTARRIGPMKAVDGAGAPITDFTAPGAVIVKVNDGVWINAVGAVEVILDELGDPSGYVYYQATVPDAGVRGFIVVDLPDAFGFEPFREEVELFPQGIPVNTTDPSLRVVGPAHALDGFGAPVLGGVGIDIVVSINGGAWFVPDVTDGSLLEASNGYYDFLPTPARATARGWIAVKFSGSCQEFTIRATIVDDTFTPAGLSLSVPAGETSAADRILGDVALTWFSASGDADISLVYDLAGTATDIATDRGLMTAVILSLFTDRRAKPDDKPPSGDPQDRRGWWADEFAPVEGDLIGSRLWLLDRAVIRSELPRLAEEYVREALAWMIEDRVLSTIDVKPETTGNALWISVGLNRPGRDPISFRFAHTWDHLQEAA